MNFYTKCTMYGLLAVIAGIGMADRANGALITDFDLDGWQNPAVLTLDQPYDLTQPDGSLDSYFRPVTFDAYNQNNQKLYNNWEIGIFKDNYNESLNSGKITFVGLMENGGANGYFFITSNPNNNVFGDDPGTTHTVEGAYYPTGGPGENLHLIARDKTTNKLYEMVHDAFQYNPGTSSSPVDKDLGIMSVGEEIIVPEPTTLALLGLGGFVGGIFNRRKD